jgi:ABC-type enterochelin transport system permease subunit
MLTWWDFHQQQLKQQRQLDLRRLVAVGVVSRAFLSGVSSLLGEM